MGVRVAIFGQGPFGKDVMERLIAAGHTPAAVYVPPLSRPDPLADEADAQGIPVCRHKSFRRKGEPIAERLEEYQRLDVALNVLPFTTVILPEVIVDAPRLGSLCFHPSLLPKFRGGTAIPWQIILGERESGVSVFRPDAGVDTGPIVAQRGGVAIEPTDTAASLYFQKLYPLGLEVMDEAVARVVEGSADPTPQDESQASFQPRVDDEVARIDWSKPAEELDRLVRGCDPQPGAHARWRGETVRLFGARRLAATDREASPGQVVAIEDGRLVVAAHGGRLAFGKLRVAGGAKVPAAEAGVPVGDRLE